MRWLAPQLISPEAVIQDFLTGPEYTVGLIGNRSGGFTVLEPLEIDYGGLSEDLPPLLTYGSKSDPESPYWQKLQFKRAELDEVTFSQMVDHCAKLFHRLSFRDYGRFDFRAGAAPAAPRQHQSHLVLGRQDGDDERVERAVLRGHDARDPGRGGGALRIAGVAVGVALLAHSSVLGIRSSHSRRANNSSPS